MVSTAKSVVGLLFLIGYISAAQQPRIVGGKDTVIKSFPFLVSIREYGRHNCGGSIISDRHILTAAHCVYSGNADGLTIHSGISNTGKEGTVHKILSIHKHPEFDMSNSEGGYPHDIAILTLESPITFNKYQKKINLPSHNVENYQVAHLIGWGRTSNWDFSSARQLQKLLVVLLPSDKCKPLIRHKMNPEQVCSFRSSTTGACHGDSGGPLVSNGAVVGIVSYGDTGTCADNAPDIYTNVFAYKDFIESAMKT